MLSTLKQDSLVLHQEQANSQTKTLLFLLLKTQSLQTVLLQKMEMFGGKELVILQKVILLTGKAIHALHSLRTRLLKVKKWLTQMHALQLLQNSVHVSLLTGKARKVYQSVQFSLVDAALQLYHLYIRLVLGNTVYSWVLS